MSKAAAGRGAIWALQGMLTFRVLIALTTSASVTAAVAGPMAYQAAKARDEVVVAAPPPTTVAPTTTAPPAAPEPEPTTSTTSTTTTSTTTTLPGAPAPTTTTAPPLTGTGLFWSAYSDHDPPVVLDGGRAARVVWIFFDGPGVASVSYWIDDPAGAGTPVTVTAAPFDLAPDGVDLRLAYGLGRHTILAEVTTVDGVTFRRLATFDVAA